MKKVSPKALERAETLKRRLTMLRAGMTPAAIAAEEHVSRQAIHKQLTAALNAVADENSEGLAWMRELENARLDEMQLAIWPSALGYVDPTGRRVLPDFEAFDRVLRVMARRAALNGLDKPKRIAVSDEDLDEAIRHELNQLAAVAQGSETTVPGTLTSEEPGERGGPDVADPASPA